jgi:hypothetical protein
MNISLRIINRIVTGSALEIRLLARLLIERGDEMGIYFTEMPLLRAQKHALRHVSIKDYITQYNPYDELLDSPIKVRVGKSIE